MAVDYLVLANGKQRIRNYRVNLLQLSQCHTVARDLILQIGYNRLYVVKFAIIHGPLLSRSIIFARVKIPIHGPNGELENLEVVHELEKKHDVRINVTAMMSAQQCYLAALAGSSYISLFGGRVNNMGYNALMIAAKDEYYDIVEIILKDIKNENINN